MWPWAFFSQIFTPKFWKLLKKDGLIQTYQRGHKAVMNVHSIGGTTERAHFVGSDQYGNKYYEDFDPLCNPLLIQTAVREDGLSTTTSFPFAAPPER